MEDRKFVVASKKDMKDLFDNSGRFENDNTLVKYYEELYKVNEEDKNSMSVFKVDIRHPEEKYGYILPKEEMIGIDSILLAIKDYEEKQKQVEHSKSYKMDYNGIRSEVDKMLNTNHKDFVKAFIGAEKGIDDEVALNKLYDYYMENDSLSLIHDDFDEKIEEMREDGLIRDNISDDRYGNLKEVVGSLVNDVDIKEVTNRETKSNFKVANFSIVAKDEEGEKVYTNVSAYGKDVEKVENLRKGDFIKVSGEERFSYGENGKEYKNLKLDDLKVLKTREQTKEGKRESTLGTISKFKKEIDNKNKCEVKINKEFER